MSPGATFERVYLALKQKLMEGAFPPGEPLEPSALSGDLNSSITPIRDALHRLVGEKLVQAPRNDGFRTPILTEAGLRDLYAWNLNLLLLAVRRASVGRWAEGAPSEAGNDEVSAADPVLRTARLFLSLACRSGSREHVAAVASLNDRLQTIRRCETLLAGDPSTELDALEAAADAFDPVRLRLSLAAYHRRRDRLVPQLIERLQPRT